MMREQLVVYLNSHIRKIIQSDNVDYIVLKQDHRDIILKLSDVENPEYFVEFKDTRLKSIE